MNRAEAEQKARALVAQMTLEEKASQLKFDAPAIPRLGIPAYNWWNEALHGVARAGTATVFPQAIGLAAMFDEDLMEEIADCIATEGRAKYNAQSKKEDRDIYKGLTFWSPNVNIFRDPRWGRGHETYGEDPYLTSRLGVRFVRGLQGTGEIAGSGHPYLKSAACAKHFAVHSGPEALRHEFDAVASPKDMEETYLPAFEACVKEGDVEAVMGAYNRTNGEVCCGSPKLQEILRGKWGFQGHFVSDCWAVRDFHEHHHVTSRPEESVKLALENGTDVNCGCTYERVMNALHEGILDEAYVTRSCERLFTTRYLLGMFDETEYDSIPYSAVECDRHLDAAARAARESVVLLKNDGILPIEETVRTIGVIGPNANSRKALIGNYHGTSSRYVTVLEGIQDFVADRHGLAGDEKVRVFYSEGCDLFRENVEELSAPGSHDRIAEALTVAEQSEVVILVVGLDETLEGEEGDTGNSYASGDKNDLLLPESQRILMEKVLDCGRPVIVINMSGSSIDLSAAEEKAAAILQAWYPGARGGANIAEILFGAVSPSGKLPVTFYRNEDLDAMPAFTDYAMKDRTYRYFTGTPLYPFGYGLTYGDCKAQIAGTEILKSSEGEKAETGQGAFGSADPGQSAVGADFAGVRVSVTAQNEGRETDDVLQIYVKDLESPCAIPGPQLAGFRRIHLAGGEERTYEIDLPVRAFTSVDEAGIRAIRGKKFCIYAGFQQPGARSEELTGASCAAVEIEV